MARVEYTPEERERQWEEWVEFKSTDWPAFRQEVRDFHKAQSFERAETDKWIAQAVVQGTKNSTAIEGLSKDVDSLRESMTEGAIYTAQTRDQVNALSVRVDSGLHKILTTLDKWEPYIAPRVASEKAWKRVGQDVRRWRDVALPAIKAMLWVAAFFSAAWVWSKGGGWHWPK